MAEPITKVITWLRDLRHDHGEDVEIGIDESGLCLRAFRDDEMLDAYYEIGGIPVRIEHGEGCGCEECARDLMEEGERLKADNARMDEDE